MITVHVAECPACMSEQEVGGAEHGRPHIMPHRDPKSDRHCMGSNLPVPNRVVRVRQ